MIEWMLKRFVRNYEDTADPAVREQYGILAGAVGMISNILLFLMKFTVGALFKSISIMADAVNNLSDAGSSLITLVGFRLSNKPADMEHPYGHARMEYVSGLIVSFIIIFLGLQLIGTSFGKILKPDTVLVGPITYAILVASVCIKLWQGLFNKTLGKKIDSTALQATATDSLNDVFATSAVLLSAIIMQLTGLQLDGWMGVGVAVFITVSGVKLAADTVNPLLGLAPSREMVDAIRDKILSNNGVIGLHDLAIHNYGPGRCFASVHVEVPASQDILISHDIIDNIERDFLLSMNLHMVIHLDPVDNDNEQINSLRELVSGLVCQIDRSLSIHDFRVVFGNTHTNLVFDVVLPPSFHMSDSALCKQIDSLVKLESETYFTVITVDRNYAFSPEHK